MILKTLGGKDDVSFTINSEGQPTLGKRNYNSLTAAAKEVGGEFQATSHRSHSVWHVSSKSSVTHQKPRLDTRKAMAFALCLLVSC